MGSPRSPLPHAFIARALPRVRHRRCRHGLPPLPPATPLLKSPLADPPQEIAEMNSPAPDIHAGAVIGGREIGEVFLSEDFKGKWVVLLFYPKAWTFVCPTEILAFSDRHREFEAINAQVVGLSTDTEETLLAWCNHPRRDGGLGRVNIPLVADPTRAISSAYGVLCEVTGRPLRGGKEAASRRLMVRVYEGLLGGLDVCCAWESLYGATWLYSAGGWRMEGVRSGRCVVEMINDHRWRRAAQKAGVAYRGLFIIDPEFKVRQISITDMPIGRSVDETLRLIQALQVTLS